MTIDEVASATALAPYIPTIPGAGDDPAVDSSTGTATSVLLPNDGDRDPTLDFGFVQPSVSVGDYVWVDTDHDGVQDDGEPGIGGVELTLTDPDGHQVTDVYGNPVGPVTTGPDGSYLFPDLPVLQPGEHYTVTVTSDPTDEIQIEGSPRDPRFVLRGEIDVSTVGALRTAVDQLDQPQIDRLDLHLGEVTFMDSTGLGWLAGLARSGCSISLFEVPPSIRKLLSVTGIDGVVSVAD